MSDEFKHQVPAAQSDDSIALSAALHALPLATPPRSALPELRLHWPATKQPTGWRRHARPWLALAATLAAIAIGVQMWPVQQDTTVAVVDDSDSRIASLMAQSADWEKILRAFDQQNIPITAGNALAGAELEDLIGLTDLQLGATETQAQAAALWQRRVRLMSRLAEVRSQSAWQRGSTDQNPQWLAAAYPVN